MSQHNSLLGGACDDPNHNDADSIDGKTFYAITVKHNTNGLMKKQYAVLINDYLDGFPHDIVESYWEMDSHDKLHYHGIFIADKGIRYHSLFQKGLHVYIRRAYNVSGWRNYISKEQNIHFIARKQQKEYEKLAMEKYLFR